MKNNEMKTSQEKKCPNCGSELVGQIGAFGARASSSPKLPEANIKVWKCDSCGEGFIYRGK